MAAMEASAASLIVGNVHMATCKVCSGLIQHALHLTQKQFRCSSSNYRHGKLLVTSCVKCSDSEQHKDKSETWCAKMIVPKYGRQKSDNGQMIELRSLACFKVSVGETDPLRCTRNDRTA